MSVQNIERFGSMILRNRTCSDAHYDGQNDGDKIPTHDEVVALLKK